MPCIRIYESDNLIIYRLDASAFSDTFTVPNGAADEEQSAALGTLMARRPSLFAIDSPLGIIGLGLALATLGYGLPIDLRWVTLPLVFFAPGNAVVSAIFGRQRVRRVRRRTVA
ncbi:MAG: hypothetical protein R2706_13365 [Acidimicrobiales bacterium]